MGLKYRPRYTPVLRALGAGAETVTEITARSTLTQGAISQSVSLMLKDRILARHQLDDGRKSGLHLTPKGTDLVDRLEPHWAATFSAINGLEAEVGYPLRQILTVTAHALERQGLGSRIEELPAAGRTRKKTK